MKKTIRTEADCTALKDLIDNLNLDHEWRFEWKKVNPKRTLDQNALYWIWMTVIGNDLGYTKDDMDREMKRHCDAPKRHWKGMDGSDQWEYSTSGADVAEMAAYMDRIQAWAASEGIGLPTPEQAARYW